MARGSQLAERDGYLLDVAEIVRRTAKTTTLSLWLMIPSCA